MEVSSHMLHKISAGIVIIDSNYKVVDSNESFARLMGEETEDLYQTIPGLKGASVQVLVPEVGQVAVALQACAGDSQRGPPPSSLYFCEGWYHRGVLNFLTLNSFTMGRHPCRWIC